jgi:adenylate cyclase class IV
MQDKKKNFESEIRIRIEDITKFQKKLETLDAKIINNYKFTDEIYSPKGEINWDHKKKAMRIRKYFNEHESKVLFSHLIFKKNNYLQFKRSKYPGGKICLFKGDKSHAKEILNDLGFRYFFTIEKYDGKLIEIQLKGSNDKFIVALEKIKAWVDRQLDPKCEIILAEIEVWAENTIKISEEFLKKLDYLDVPKEKVISDTVPFYISRILGLT